MPTANHQRFWLSAIIALVLLGLLSLAAPNRNWHASIPLFLLIGTVFGQTSLAAAWFALGPFSLARRLPLSAIWITAIILTFGWKMGGTTVPHETDLMLTFAVIVPGQWALVAIPLALAAGCFGLRLESTTSSTGSGASQIGIREALFLTLVVAIVLGGARYKTGDLSRASIIWDEIFIFASLVVASVAIGLPLIAVMFWNRHWLPKLIYTLLFLATVCILEFCCLNYWSPFPSTLAEFLSIFATINLSQTVWIVAVTTLVRLAGFTLTSNRTRAAAPAIPTAAPNP